MINHTAYREVKTLYFDENHHFLKITNNLDYNEIITILINY